MSIASRIESMTEHLTNAWDNVDRLGLHANRLPKEYTQVDYIQSSGSQYIDTGIKGNQDTKVNLDFEGTDFSYSGNKTIIGSRTSATEKHYGITISAGANPYLYSGYNNVSQEGVRISLNTKYNVFKDKNTTYLDNTQMTNTTYTTFETSTNMYIFAMNEGGAKFYSSIKLFTLKIYNNNELIRDFIPCYRNSDNEVGLYDLVNDVFYTNQGTGAFTYGEIQEEHIDRNLENLSLPLNDLYNEVSDKTDLSVNGVVGRTSQDTLLPSEYTQVDYIESSGTQYIDTGVNADNNLRVVLDFAYTSISLSNQNIGATRLESGNNARYHILLGGSPTTNRTRVFVNDSGYYTIDDDTNRHLYDINPSIGQVLIDNTSYTIPSNIKDVGLNFWLFGRNSTSTIYLSKVKQWACKMYYNNILVRDFIPCYRNSDNEVGLYDLVNDVFYTNQGTGDFTYGSVVDIPNPDYPQPINNLSGNVAYKVSGKNLFVAEWIRAYLTSSGTMYTSSAGVNSLGTNNYIEVKPNTEYFLSCVYGESVGSVANVFLAEYDENEQFIQRLSHRDNKTFTTNSNTKYIRISWYLFKNNEEENIVTNPDNPDMVVTDIQLEENSIATNFEPYIEPQTFNIPLGDIELCEIDTYEDKIYSSNGRFYLNKNIGNHLFTTSDNISKGGSSTDGYARCGWGLTSEIATSDFTKALVICNKFLGVPQNDNTTSTTGQHWYCSVSNTDNFKIMFRCGDTEYTRDTFPEFIKNNEIIVYYPLKEPTTTEITSSNYPTLYNALKQIQDYLTAYKINKEFILGYSSPEIEY